MGTMIQRYKLDEAAYRGERFRISRATSRATTSCCRSRSRRSSAIHDQYFAARASSRPRSARRLAQSDYEMEDLVVEMNIESAKLAREAGRRRKTALRRGRDRADAENGQHLAGRQRPGRTQRHVRRAARVVLPAGEGAARRRRRPVPRRDDLRHAEREGCAVRARRAVRGHRRAPADHDLGTVTDASGRILSGQTVEAFWNSLRHAKPLTFGLNCARAALMRPYIAEPSCACVSCYPNAGLPNPMAETGFDETPDVTSGLLKEFAQAGVNLAGCCGTTPGTSPRSRRRSPT